MFEASSRIAEAIVTSLETLAVNNRTVNVDGPTGPIRKATLEMLAVFLFGAELPPSNPEYFPDELQMLADSKYPKTVSLDLGVISFLPRELHFKHPRGNRTFKGSAEKREIAGNRAVTKSVRCRCTVAGGYFRPADYSTVTHYLPKYRNIAYYTQQIVRTFEKQWGSAHSAQYVPKHGTLNSGTAICITLIREGVP